MLLVRFPIKISEDGGNMIMKNTEIIEARSTKAAGTYPANNRF